MPKLYNIYFQFKYSLVPTFELYPKANQGAYDKFSWRLDRHLPLNLSQVMIHIHSSLD